MQSKILFSKIFWKGDEGQDLVEYSLIMAFVCLASAALFLGVGSTIKSIWTATNTSLSQAYSATS